MTIQDAISKIDEDGYVQDIGQLTDIKKLLDKMVRKGKLKKTRMPWLGYLGGMKTTYYKEVSR